MKILISILIISCLNGCAYFGKNFVIGAGTHEKEYYQDGTLKKEKKECKSPVSDVVNIQALRTN